MSFLSNRDPTMKNDRTRITRRRFLRDAGAIVVGGGSLKNRLAIARAREGALGFSDPSHPTLTDSAGGGSIGSVADSMPNLVPEQPGETPSYWCTWGAQASTINDANAGGQLAAADNLNETLVFKDPGWLTHYFQKVRKGSVCCL